MKVKVNLFERDNYHTTIEIPNYKQVRRVVNSLKKYAIQQHIENEKNNKIRIYTFEVERCETYPMGMYLTETDIKNYTR